MSIWAAAFSIYWKRNQRALRVEWDNMYYTEADIEMIRPEFEGDPSINPITEKVEPYYNSHKRYLNYLFSFVAILPCFVGVFYFLIFWYNVTGVITAEGQHKDFYFHEIGQYAAKDAILDPDSWAGTAMGIV
jgi:hypothetical protein